ncbi:HPr family phosphocarrier protein [Lentzea tibetensis]|uniref:Phosphocarrier protein HPr n=1 Tax=Lentzea tibetensis TaxID=2591470 RepID=A0A563EGQ5_9PSEU|nr:HPr family phosphocarrier protein [Lentzea tibetensis]TWP45628.1 HPr family phosphocarrier protein [Lentzea tibetensis]
MSPSSSAQASVVLPAHLHARPAGKLAQSAARFTATIHIGHNGRTVNPTGVLALMSLGATAGTTVTITADGPDAQAAVDTLAEILTTAE